MAAAAASEGEAAAPAAAPSGAAGPAKAAEPAAAGRSPCALQRRMLLLFSSCLRALGTGIGRRPVCTCAGSLLLFLAALSLIAGAEWESRLEYTYVPRSSDSFREYEEIGAAFRDRAQSSEALVRARDGGSMLRPEYLQSAWRVHSSLFYATGADGAQLVDICVRHPVTRNCTVASIFDFLPEATFPESLQSASELGDAPSFEGAMSRIAALQAQGTAGLSFVLGRSHDALRLWYGVRPPSSEDRGLFRAKSDHEARVLSWETAFQEVVTRSRGADPLVEVVGISGHAVDDEISRNVTAASPFMAGAIVLILIFMALMLGGRPLLRSRLSLAAGAVCLVMLAEGAGFAIAIACGVPLTDVSLLVIFLAVGVGVDDILVLTDAFDAADAWLPPEERLGEAFARGGTAIMLTSLTNLVAFLVASTSDLPAIAWFCATAGWVVLCLFLVTISMYAPLLVLDERRRGASRYDCVCCFQSPSSLVAQQGEDKDRRSPTGLRVRRWLKRVLVPLTADPLPAAISMLVLLGIAAAGAACLSMPQVFDVGLPLSGSFPEGSHVTEYLDEILPRHFDGMVDSLAVGVRGVDFADAAIQERMLELQRDFSRVDGVGEMRFLLPSLQSWVDCTAEGGATAELDFDSRVREFLSAPSFEDCNSTAAAAIVPSEFGQDVAWDADGARIEVLCMRASCVIATTVQGRIDFMKSVRSRFDSHGMPGFAFSYNFLFAARDERLWELIGSTLIYAGVAVILTAALFNHPLGSALIALCVAMVDLSLFAWMAAWDVPIDATSFICLAIAAGLSADYMLHQAHAVLGRGLPKTRADMPLLVEHALDTTGTSVLKGALSTLLGVLLLSGAPTMVFRLFFKMLFGIVVFGVLAGFIMFPASLTLCISARDALCRPSQGDRPAAA